MGCGCCQGTKVVNADVAVVKTQKVEATTIPYGYVSIYPGVLMSNGKYSSPILSIHTYRISSKKTLINYAEAQFSNKKADPKIDGRATSNEEDSIMEEKAIMIPVEDIISIYYTSDVKKNTKAVEHSRLVPVAEGKGCCSSCCKKPAPPKVETKTSETKVAERVITLHIQHSKYSYVDTVSNARILRESDRAQFYNNHLQPNEILTFYLVRNAEFDSYNFYQTKMQAEELCRVIMQLKGMNVESSRPAFTKDNVVYSAAPISYPSPQELNEILQQSSLKTFGNQNEGYLGAI